MTTKLIGDLTLGDTFRKGAADDCSLQTVGPSTLDVPVLTAVGVSDDTLGSRAFNETIIVDDSPEFALAGSAGNPGGSGGALCEANAGAGWMELGDSGGDYMESGLTCGIPPNDGPYRVCHYDGVSSTWIYDEYDVDEFGERVPVGTYYKHYGMTGAGEYWDITQTLSRVIRLVPP